MMHEPPSLAFWRHVDAVARRCLEHPFVQGLADGSLPRERYAAYVAQDAFYLHGFARAYAVGLARTPRPEDMRTFLELLEGVFSELELHRRSAAELGIDLESVRPASATSAYTDFLLGCAWGGSVGELLSAMTPCMRLYAYLGQELAKRASSATPYADWISNYSSDDMQQLASKIERLLDRHASGSRRELENYCRAMDLEERFFDAAWRGEMGSPRSQEATR